MRQTHIGMGENYPSNKDRETETEADTKRKRDSERGRDRETEIGRHTKIETGLIQLAASPGRNMYTVRACWTHVGAVNQVGLFLPAHPTCEILRHLDK